MKNDILKSIGAVLIGIVLTVALSIGTDVTLQKTGIFPPQDQGAYQPWMLAVALAYRCVYGVAGAYLTATLAPNKPMLHVIIPGILGTLVSALGLIGAWGKPDLWYPAALVITALPCALLGGTLKARKQITTI